MGKAYDMSKYQRIVAWEGNRIRGDFKVLDSKDGSEKWVKPIDVTIYVDDNHSWGRCVYYDDFTASVKSGTVNLPKHMISERVLFDVEDAWDEMVEALKAVSEVEW